MAINSYPFENQDTSEAQYSKLFREFQDSGIVGSVGATDFLLSTDGSGMDVQVAPGYAIVRGHAVESTATETLTLAVATAQPRIDRVVLRLDPAANSIVLAVLTGTPAASPLAPTLTQTDTGIYELPVAQIAVAANAVNITSGMLTDQRRYVSGRVGVWTTATRPTAPRTGVTFGYNTTLATYEFWNGSAWATVGGPKRIRVPHTWTVGPEVAIPVGDTDFIVPFFLPEPSGQVVRLAGARYRINSGTSVTAKLQLDGVDVPGFTGLSVTTTSTTVDPADVDVTDGQRLSLVVTAIAGSPKNMTFTVFIDYEV